MLTHMVDWLKAGVARARSEPRALLAAAIGALVALAALAGASPVSVAAAALGVVSGGFLVTLWNAGKSPLRDGPSPSIPAPRPVRADLAPLQSWRSLLDALPDAAVAIDRDFNVVHANQHAHAMFAALQHGAPVALASRAPELADALARALADGGTLVVRLHERVPIERRLDATVARLTATRDPTMPALLVVLHDISERDRLAQMRADFIAHASHELRTPLAALRGFIETLQGPARNDAAARERFLGIMSTEALRMTRILDDLLSLARVEMRAHIPPVGRVDIEDALNEVVRGLASLASAASVTVAIEGSPNGRFVRGDRDEIVQVFVNLIQNAIKYGCSGGKVVVKVAHVPGRERPVVSIAVIDDGPGIAPEHLPRLTERFYRVDDKSSREKGGTGLGLAIVKHILNRHQGALLITSELGRGSTFTVELPAAQPT